MTDAEKVKEYEKAIRMMLYGYNYGSGYYNEESFISGLKRCFKLVGAKWDWDQDCYTIDGKNPRPRRKYGP